MEDKITIIEGPTPEFEDISDGWALGLNESPLLYDTIFTQVRTLNGPALVERCHRAWKENDTIYLHFKNRMGIEEKAPITAVRSVDTDEGQILLLWVRQLPSYNDLINIAEDMSDIDDESEEDVDDDLDIDADEEDIVFEEDLEEGLEEDLDLDFDDDEDFDDDFFDDDLEDDDFEDEDFDDEDFDDEDDYED